MWEKKFAKIKHWNKKVIFSFTDWLLRISSKIVIKRKVDACMVSRAKLSFEAQNNAIETFLTTSNFYFWIRTNNLLNAKKSCLKRNGKLPLECSVMRQNKRHNIWCHTRKWNIANWIQSICILLPNIVQKILLFLSFLSKPIIFMEKKTELNNEWQLMQHIFINRIRKTLFLRKYMIENQFFNKNLKMSAQNKY